MLNEVLADLAAESDELDRTVSKLSDVDFCRDTPAAGWTIAHQISHLAWTDAMTLIAITEPGRFIELLTTWGGELDGFIDRGAAEGLGPRDELLQRWRAGRATLAAALVDSADKGDGRIPWVGTTMTPASLATARLMETWAHAQDVADTLGRPHGFAPRLRHIAWLGYRTFGHGFAAHGRPVPDTQVRVELSTPDGELWTFGPADAADRVVGPALDFCLLVTQRRHPADLALQASGPNATEWLYVAQAYAGPPGEKRQPTGATA